jgi:hypothetical protein
MGPLWAVALAKHQINFLTLCLNPAKSQSIPSLTHSQNNIYDTTRMCLNGCIQNGNRYGVPPCGAEKQARQTASSKKQQRGGNSGRHGPREPGEVASGLASEIILTLPE